MYRKGVKRWIPRAQFLARKRARAGGPARAPATRGRVASIPSPELKFHDVDIDDAVVQSAGDVDPAINLIAAGTTESTRIGRKVTILSIGWRYSVTLPEVDAAATPAPGDVIRVMLVLDKQCNGAAATVTDMLETTGYQSFNNLSNKSRFRTLHDATFPLNYLTLASDNAAVVSSAEVWQHYTFFKKVKIPIEFSAGTGALTEIRSNNLFVLLITKRGAAGFESKMRLRFSDG